MSPKQKVKQEVILKHTGESFKKYKVKNVGKREEWFVRDKKGYPLHFIVDKRSFVRKHLLSLIAIILSLISIFLFFKF